MADAIGLSKKTLVDIEKQRRSLGWMGSVALCQVFAQSEVLAAAFGGPTAEIITSLAFVDKPAVLQKAAAGRPWWTTIEQNERYVIQLNTISLHYRLLTHDGGHVASSFDIDDLLPVFDGKREEGGA